jgi:hypothetical protein
MANGPCAVVTAWQPSRASARWALVSAFAPDGQSDVRQELATAYRPSIVGIPSASSYQEIVDELRAAGPLSRGLVFFE